MIGVRKYYFEAQLRTVEEVIEEKDGARINEQIEKDVKLELETLQDPFNIGEYIDTSDVEIDGTYIEVVGAKDEGDPPDKLTDLHEEI